MNMPIEHYQYAMDGEFVEVKIPKAALIFTYGEWQRAIKRGKSILRARQSAKRELTRKGEVTPNSGEK